MERPSCPRCGGEKFVGGQCVGGEGPAWQFAPNQIRSFRLKAGVWLTTGFSACLSCGHLWGAVDPNALRSFLLKYGNELAKQNLDRLDGVLLPDLLATESGRAVAAILAALDRLVLLDKAADLPEKFQAMTGVTWEEASKATRKWQHLTRDEKLDRLGWIVTPKHSLDDLAEPLL